MCKMTVGFYFVLIAASSLQMASGATTKGPKNTTKEIIYTPIQFPGPTNDLGTRYGTEDKDIPDKCKNLTYCSEKPKDYPQDFFDTVFKGTKATPPILVLTGDRQGDPDDKSGCDSEVTYEPLYKVRSKRGWHTVAQAPKENYVQMVRLEKCVDLEKPCFARFTAPSDLVTFCKQTLSVWEFVVLNEDQSDTEKVQVELPICCSCYYKVKGL